MFDEKEGKGIPWWRIVLAVGVAYALFYAWALSKTHATLIVHYGALGDAFAPLTAFASTVGLIGALVSVNLQRKELALQRRELELQRQEMRESRAELKRTAAAQEAQVKALEAAALMAEAQKGLLDESTKAARTQALAVVAARVEVFLQEADHVEARLRKWHADAMARRRVNPHGLTEVTALKVPTAPLILGETEYEIAGEIARNLRAAQLRLVELFSEWFRSDPHAFSGDAEDVLGLVNQSAGGLLAFRQIMSEAVRREPI